MDANKNREWTRRQERTADERRSTQIRIHTGSKGTKVVEAYVPGFTFEPLADVAKGGDGAKSALRLGVRFFRAFRFGFCTES
jgi:hypothetical protein